MSNIDLHERIVDADSRIYTIDGVNYVSVTSVFSLVKLRDFIDVWKEGLIARYGERYYTDYMNEVADQGSVMHGIIEYYLRNINVQKNPLDMHTPLSNYNSKDLELIRPEWIWRFNDKCPYITWKKFENWSEWLKTADVSGVVELETQVHSTIHRYAGRFDAILERKALGKGLHDWKSSKGVNEKHKMQASAYYFAYAERTGEYLDYASIICCGMSTKKGWHETILVPAAKATKKTKETDTLEYWFEQYQKHLALAIPLIERMKVERSIPRYIPFIPLVN